MVSSSWSACTINSIAFFYSIYLSDFVNVKMEYFFPLFFTREWELVTNTFEEPSDDLTSRIKRNLARHDSVVAYGASRFAGFLAPNEAFPEVLSFQEKRHQFCLQRLYDLQDPRFNGLFMSVGSSFFRCHVDVGGRHIPFLNFVPYLDGNSLLRAATSSKPLCKFMGHGTHFHRLKAISHLVIKAEVHHHCFEI